MSKQLDLPVWKTAPFIRLLLPLMAGIVIQFYQQTPLDICIVAIAGFLLAYLLVMLLPLSLKFKLRWLQGIILNLLMAGMGMLFTWQNDVRHNPQWFGNFHHDDEYLVVRINEPLIEKVKSYKADGVVEAVLQQDSLINTKGKLLLYFSKDSTGPALHYGDKILIHKNLLAIKNSGNPGAFNYQRYAGFQQVFHNVFLKNNDWIKLPDKNISLFRQFLFTARENIIAILRKNIPAAKDELGIAEALLIGYTNDLDKDLVQAYSNTGVVHIIAISGMHLGLIYVMLVWLFAKIPLINQSKITQVVLILSCLWLFSLLTGGAASVLRSAVMFTCIAVGKAFSKQSSIFNALAASAFVMLCYNPYYLWDVGFQLSYLAVIGIIIFQRPVYNWLYIKNKWVNEVWKLTAISLAAQVLTFPVCVYYFHQFPNLFLLTNIIAVPLSTCILFAEIALVVFSWVPYAGIIIGQVTGWLLWVMNQVIVWVSRLPFAVWDNISATLISTWLLYAVVIGLSIWLLNKNKNWLRLAIYCLLCFTVTQAWGEWQRKGQRKVVVYNVSQHQAIDFIDGHSYQFAGDSILLADGVLQNFNLKPARIAMQLHNLRNILPVVFNQHGFYQFGNKKIAVVDKPLQFENPLQKIDVDIIILSKNAKVNMAQLAAAFNCSQYIFDASNSLWKIGKWQKDCEELHLRSYSVQEQGAFVLEVD